MPRATKVPVRAGLPDNTFVLDNGAYTLKAGFAPKDDTSPTDILSLCEVIPNCLVRTRDRKVYIGTQCEEIAQWNEAIYRRPMENGQLVNWEAQKEIWDLSFFEERTARQNVYVKDASATTLIFTETPNTMPALQRNADEIIMEEWGFGGYMRTVGATLNAYNDLHPIFESQAALKAHSASETSVMQCLLVIDSGFSHTTIVPVYEGRAIQRAVRRLDLGGKHITNLMKEIISVRHFDLHQDTKIVNDIKEDVAYVSLNFREDMEKTWKGNKSLLKSLSSFRDQNGDMEVDSDPLSQDVRVDYILPDGIRLLKGYSRPHDPSAVNARKRKLNVAAPESNEIVMTMGNERFTIPEALFNPADIGSKQPGLVDCVMQSLSVLPPLIQSTMLANTLVVGGNARILGFVDRLQNELRAHVSTDWIVRVRKLDDPIKSTWLGGANLAINHGAVVQEYGVTREDYLEYGMGWMARRFTQGKKAET